MAHVNYRRTDKRLYRGSELRLSTKVAIPIDQGGDEELEVYPSLKACVAKLPKRYSMKSMCRWRRCENIGCTVRLTDHVKAIIFHKRQSRNNFHE
jgi:hypothetical protein